MARIVAWPLGLDKNIPRGIIWPMPLPPDLPVCSLRRPFLEALERGPVVVTSPTGSGKSTWIPVWSLELSRRVLVIEPRRVACRSLARYVARCLDVELGREVGYAVRHDDRLTSDTRIGYITPGVALRMLAGGADPEQVLILDEFHLRGLETDLLLALLLAWRHPRLCVLSATLHGERVARHVGGTLLSADGRQFPVSIRHLGDQPVPGGQHLAERVAGALSELREGHEGDVLVFLPGKAEIAACQKHLARDPVFVPQPLHAELRPDEQDRAFEPSPRRRAILSTNVAETSVTLPWVRAVIDSGLVRRTTYREGRGALTLTPIALDAADQRAGRGGRLGPGVCLRLWARSGKLEPFSPPEIHREDLSQLCLQAARFGFRVEDLPWLDPPRDYAVKEARALLTSLGLVDSPGRLTASGRQVGALPLDPVLGRLLVSAKELGEIPDMVRLVAALSVGRPLLLPLRPERPEGPEPDPLVEPRCDVTALVLCLRDPKLARGRVRGEVYAEARRVADQLARLLGVDLSAPAEAVERDRLARVIFHALPRSAFARRPRRSASWGNGKVEVVLDRQSLIDEQTPTILVVDQRLIADRGRRVKRIATCCMPVPPWRLRELGAGETRVAKARVKDDVLWAGLEWAIGTTVLETREEVPRGSAAREALVNLLLQGGVLSDAVQAAREALAAHNLWCELHREGSPLQLEAWLRQRLETLGFDSGDDLPLLGVNDLVPTLLSEAQRAEIDRRFPQALSIGDLRLRASYDLARRRVTLRATLAGRPPPRSDFLPPWPGWSVAYDDGKHTVVLRDGR